VRRHIAGAFDRVLGERARRCIYDVGAFGFDGFSAGFDGVGSPLLNSLNDLLVFTPP
jgi:hypothetical protein